MTGRQRIEAAFSHRESDVVPRFEQSIASDVASALLGREAFTGTVYMHYQEACAWCQGEAAHAEFLERLYQDVVATARLLKLDMLHEPWRLEERPSRRIDERTFLYGDPEGDHVIRTFDAASKTFGVAKTVRRTPVDPYDMDALEAGLRTVEREAEELTIDDPAAAFPSKARLMAEYGDRYAVTGSGGIAIPLKEGWLAACALRPDLVERLLDAQVVSLIKRYEAQAALGLKIIWGGNDLADKNGPVYGPAVFREMVLPRLKRLTDRCHELGLKFLFRSDGNLWSIADDLFVASGVDGYGEIDHDAGMTLERLKPLYGDRLCFWGNVPTGSLMVRGTAGQVRDFARRLIDVAAPGGGFILGSSNSIVPNTPPENVLALFQAAEG
jgi:uroporphyrinogen decarboxylase